MIHRKPLKLVLSRPDAGERRKGCVKGMRDKHCVCQEEMSEGRARDTQRVPKGQKEVTRNQNMERTEQRTVPVGIVAWQLPLTTGSGTARV